MKNLFITFERLLETYLGKAFRGLRSFIVAIQVLVKEKLFLKSEIKKKFNILQKEINPDLKKLSFPKLLFSEHHLSYTAAAFYPSPFIYSIF